MGINKNPGCFAFCATWKRAFSASCSSIRNAFRGCIGKRNSKLDHDENKSAVTTVSLTVKEDKENTTVAEAAQATEPAPEPQEPEAVSETVPETAAVAATWTNLNTPLTIFVLLCIAEVASDMAEMSNEEGTEFFSDDEE